MKTTANTTCSRCNFALDGMPLDPGGKTVECGNCHKTVSIETETNKENTKMNTSTETTNNTTIHPVTIGGWYEHVDGTVGEYRWVNRSRMRTMRLVRTVASWAKVPDREEELRQQIREMDQASA